MSELVETHVPCPSCTSSDAYCTYDDGHGYCFSCGFYKNKNGEVEDAKASYQYMPWRGVTTETMRFYDVKTKVGPDDKPIELGYKYPNGSYKIRSLAEKAFHTKGEISQAGLFGRDKFSAGGHRYVTITEGELDALSLYQAIGGPCVSIQSAGTGSRDCAHDRAWLNSFERIYLAFDNDGPGREAVRSVAKLFDFNKIFVVKFTTRKDASEFIQAGEHEELKKIWWNSKKYLPDEIISSFDEFQKALTKPTWGVEYPWPTLSFMTYGLRTGESVLLTAQEGVGKTEIMHAIEYQLLKETDDAIGAIFLEEPKRRHIQAIAGIELKAPVHLPDCNRTEAEIMAAVQKVVRVDDRLHVYSHFGSDDAEVLLDTIRFMVSARSCRWVLLDHISMAVSGLAGEDERRALDYLSTRLEMMVKELDFGLIMVSHVNDDGKTRGSRYISKVADIRIDAVRDLETSDAKERCTTHLTVSKNRYCGRTGPAGKLLFDPGTYTLREDTGYVEADANFGQGKSADPLPMAA